MALINIGSLFVDSYLIEILKNAKQVLNPAEKVENNPVLWPEHPWEGNYLGVSHVWFDDKDQIFKMWYVSAMHRVQRGTDGRLIAEAPRDHDPYIACLALSEDGIDWKRPELGLVEYQGSKQNNILPSQQFMPYFFQDLYEADPAKRYKGLIRTDTTRTPGMTFDLYYSPNSVTWSPYEHNPVIATPTPGSVAGGRPTSWAGIPSARSMQRIWRTACIDAVPMGSG